MTPQASLLIVDDHVSLATALAETLKVRGFANVHVASSFRADDLVAEVRRRSITLVLLDLYLGRDETSLPLIGPLLAEGTKVVMLTGSGDRSQHGEAVRLGAHAVLNKGMQFDALIDALHREIEGAGPSPERAALLAELAESERAERRRLEPFGRLTPREAVVLAHLIDGRAPAEIATVEHVALTTVRSQLVSMFAKLGVGSQREAITTALRAGWRKPTSGREIVQTNEDG